MPNPFGSGDPRDPRLIALRRQAAEQAAQESRQTTGDVLGYGTGALGAIVGGLTGGPAGVTAGFQAGNSLGRAVSDVGHNDGAAAGQHLVGQGSALEALLGMMKPKAATK